MNDTRLRIFRFLMLTALIVGGGCGGGAPSEDTSTEEATVTGVVTFKGKPLTKGDITFQPGNASRPTPPRKSTLKNDGSYTVKTLVGENEVLIFSPVIQKAGPDLPPFSHRVTPGENKFDIKLPLEEN